jgi:hypothetical protein
MLYSISYDMEIKDSSISRPGFTLFESSYWGAAASGLADQIKAANISLRDDLFETLFLSSNGTFVRPPCSGTADLAPTKRESPQTQTVVKDVLTGHRPNQKWQQNTVNEMNDLSAYSVSLPAVATEHFTAV